MISLLSPSKVDMSVMRPPQVLPLSLFVLPLLSIACSSEPQTPAATQVAPAPAPSTVPAPAPPAPEPKPGLSPALESSLGSWFNADVGTRINIAHDEEGKPVVTLYDYSERDSTEAQGELVRSDGVIVFSEQMPWNGSMVKVFFEIKLLDGTTQEVRLRFPGVGSDADMSLTFDRSKKQGVEMDEEEAALVGGKHAMHEAMSNVDGLKTALLAYDAAFDVFMAASPWPRPVEAVDSSPTKWSRGSAFDTLGWAPDGEVRGSYSIDVTPDGRDFTVHAWIDGDGDGIRAHVTATRHQNATLQTQEGVY